MSTLLRTVLLTGPTSLTATPISPSQISLVWTAVLNATSYRVYRNGTLVDSPTGTSSSSTGLTASTLYTFQVSSVGTEGEGPKGASASATTLALADTIAPSVPSGVAATALSTTTIRVNWNASTDTGGSGLAGYRVYRSTTLAGTYAQISGDIGTGTLTYSDTTLSASTTRYYKVLAFDGSTNASALSAAANATTFVGSTPGVIRFSPGHYKWIDTGSGGGGQTGELAQISALSGKAYMVGAKWAPDWADLEGAVQGDYTAGFAKADLYRNAAAAAGKKLMIDPKFQYFGSSPTSISGKFPQYLTTIDSGNPGYSLWPGGTPWNGNLILVAHLWKSTVMPAYIALGQAYANRYKDDPVVEMWSTGETAIDAPSGSGYTAAGWLTQLKLWMTAMRAAWPNTAVRVPTNYLGSDAQMQELIAHALVEKIACGGPDNYSRVYQSNPIFTGFNGGIDYRNRIPWVSESQYPASSSGGPDAGDPDVSSSTIYAHNFSGALSAGGSTNGNYVIWFNNTYTGNPPGTYHTYPAETEPFIAGISGACNTTNPYQPPAPTYAPLFISNLTGGNVGNAPISSEWSFVQQNSIKYSSDVPGPFGESKCGKLIVPGGGVYPSSYFFAGYIHPETTLTSGEDLYVRVYQRFTSSFCAAYSNTSGTNDGYGNTKWFRGYFNDHPFWTFHLENFSFRSCNPSGPRIGDIETDTGIAGFESSGVILNRDEWIAMQLHVRCSSVAANAFCRVWLGETYLGQLSTPTMTTHPGGTTRFSLVMGDYWNGGAHQTSTVYLGDIIVSKQTPNTLDSGGRPFIHPSHKKADFA